jgi:hypothetical protein
MRKRGRKGRARAIDALFLPLSQKKDDNNKQIINFTSY